MGRDPKLSRLSTWMGHQEFVDLVFFDIKYLFIKLLSIWGNDPLVSFLWSSSDFMVISFAMQ